MDLNHKVLTIVMDLDLKVQELDAKLMEFFDYEHAVDLKLMELYDKDKVLDDELMALKLQMAGLDKKNRGA